MRRLEIDNCYVDVGRDERTEDGKSRPVEPGTFPLVAGVPGRVVQLRGYGNAICVPLAAQFIGAVMEALGE